MVIIVDVYVGTANSRNSSLCLGKKPWSMDTGGCWWSAAT